MKIVGIDVGHTNLALVVAEVEIRDNCEIGEISVEHAQMTNLGDFVCEGGECMFKKNDRSASHKCHHWVDDMENYFRDSDLVLMERQPLCGLTGIEQAIYIFVKQRYSAGREGHILLMSPNMLHSHFKMSSSKETRRREIVNICREYLEISPAFVNAKEKDHLADAMGFILLYIQRILPQQLKAQRRNRFAHYMYMNDSYRLKNQW